MNSEPISSRKTQLTLRGMFVLVSFVAVIAWATKAMVFRDFLDPWQIAAWIGMGGTIGALLGFLSSSSRDVTTLGGISGCITVWLTICWNDPDLQRQTGIVMLAGVGAGMLILPGIFIAGIVWRYLGIER